MSDNILTRNQSIHYPSYSGSKAGNLNLVQRFMAYAEGQQYNRLLWVGLGLMLHGCLITPITALVILFNGHQFPLIITCIASMTMVVVPNLAAMPTKYTVPLFFLSLLIDIGLIITALAGAA